MDNIEVDDAVSITRNSIKDSYTVAIDKDLLWTRGCNYNWSKNEWVTVNDDEAKYYFWKSMIVGEKHRPKLFNSVKPY